MLKMIDTMETMVGARIFSTMDLKSGFWQVKMAEESQPYTAFTVRSLGVYKFLRMPFGLCNAPATFQRLMQNCLGELNLTYALIYLDDIVVFSDSEGGTCETAGSSLRAIPGARPETEAVEVQLFPEGDQLLGASC